MQIYLKKQICYLFLIIFLLSFLGCATPARKEVFDISKQIPGVWHYVEKGETLWRISKVYGVDLEELARINKIYDVRNITTGQFIFIPHAKETKKINIYQKEKEEGFIWPLEGKIVSFFFDKKDGYLNKGIDIIPNRSDKTLVVAARSGVVAFCDDLKGYDKAIIIDHGDGFSTVYAGNKEISTSLNEYVPQGKQIASVTYDGGVFHFEIRRDRRPLNPIYFLPNY